MTPNPDAKRRALQLLVSQVGAPPAVDLQPQDLATLAPPMPAEEQEGVATFAPQEPPEDTEARLRTDADRMTRFADLGAVGAGFIEGTTGARGADIWTPMRERAQDPLKAFHALQQRATTTRQPAAGKPPKAPPDPNSPESKRLQAFARSRWPQETDEVIAAIVPETFESIRKTLDSKYGIQSREGLAEKTTEQRAKEHKDKIYMAAQRLGLDEKKLEQAMTMLGMRLEDSEANRNARVKLAEDAATAKTEARTEDQSKEFGVKYAESGFPEFKDQYDKAQAVFTKYPKSLPGVGLAAGRVPTRFTSADGKVLRAVAGQMLLSYKKSVTGLGSSAKEDEAIQNATGLIQTGDDDSIRMGVSLLKDVMDAKEKALQAGYKQEAVDAVIARLPRPGKAAATTTPTQAPTRPEVGKSDGAVRKQYSKSRNRTREVDASGKVLREYDGPPHG